MTNKEAIEELKGLQEFINGTRLKGEIRAEAFDLAIKALESQPQWIPVKTRDMAAGEIANLREKCDYFDSDYADFWCYDCPLPNDQQDVLITTRWGISLVTFCCDSDDGCSFDDYTDRDDVMAWMPLPEPYSKEEQS